ncbi:MAG: hypothetical protein EON96_16490 [Caulobacteraceae bacterium]|nr:MAG: hypothetical protein EON96_16490 [Caulobacteraceae bacterium]
MMRVSVFTPALIVGVIVAGAALAQMPAQTPPPAGSMAGGMAGGGMGLMPPRSADQVAAWADRLFTRLDANQDAAITGDEMSMLTRPEIASRGGGRLRAMISQSDTSRDARISREELVAGAERMFARMDRNGDGQISDDELPQQPAPPRPPSIPMPAPTPMPMPMPPEGM